MRPALRRPSVRVQPHDSRLVILIIALAAAVPAARAESLAALLDSGALEETNNPVAATYFAEQARNRLPPEVAEKAAGQLKVSLRRQTDPVLLMMGGMMEMGHGKASRQVTEEANRNGTTTRMSVSLLAGMAGFNGVGQQHVTQRQSQGMQQEMKQEVAGPWIRGVEAARAMERLGDAQQAGRFYINCIQAMTMDWMNDVALGGILGMGPKRSLALLSWMADNAEQISVMRVTGMDASYRQRGELDPGTVAIRGAALRGLGSVVGSGALSPQQRDAALAQLRRYAAGDAHAPYFADAALGLGRTRDPSAVADLQRLAGWRKNPHVAECAQAGLAIGFHDAAAIEHLRGRLKSRLPDDVLRALPWLLEAGDPETQAWAVRTVTARRAAEDVAPDIRPQVVRELAELHGGKGRALLGQIAAQGAGNDWLQAWVAVALLELGDRDQLAAVCAALDKTDWTLDRPGLKYYWSRIRPVVNLVAGAAMGAAVTPTQIAQVVGNMAADELARRRGNADDRELTSVQLRWQAAAALGRVDDPAAAAALARLLDDPELAVRMNAATALAISPSADSLGGIVRAMTLDFGGDDGVARAPAIRAALLRSAVDRFPGDARTRDLCAAASADSDAGVRFIADAALALN